MPKNNENQPSQRPPRTPKEKALRIFRREAPAGGYIQRPDAPYYYGGDLGQHDPNQKVFNPELTKSPKFGTEKPLAAYEKKRLEREQASHRIKPKRKTQ